VVPAPSGRQGNSTRRHPGPISAMVIEKRLHASSFLVAVVAALPDDEMLPAGDRATQSNRERPSPRCPCFWRHTFIDRRNVFAYQLRQAPFQFRRSRAERLAPLRNASMTASLMGAKIVAEKMRREGGVIVDIALSIGVHK